MTSLIEETNDLFIMATQATNEDGDNLSKIQISKDSFSIKQYITGMHVLTVNQHNLFGIEPVTDFGGTKEDLTKECRFNGLIEPIQKGG